MGRVFLRNDAMIESKIPLASIKGKVRDTYDISELINRPALLIIATDRISAYDTVLDQPIPEKGKILTQMTLFWLESLNIAYNHLITASFDEYPKSLKKYKNQLENRSMIVEKHDIIPIECIVRGYLTGSGKVEYDKKGSIGWYKLPGKLEEASMFPEPIFTPSTKAEEGKRDENIDSKFRAKEIISIFLDRFSTINSHNREEYAKQILNFLQYISIEIYEKAHNIARERGVILADTKFEFGYKYNNFNTKLVLCDEVLTPDSSRFWPLDEYRPSVNQASFDKQYVRDYLSSIGFTGQGKVPNLPQAVIEKTTEKYIQAYEMITQKKYTF